MGPAPDRAVGPHPGWSATRLLATAFVAIGFLFALTTVLAVLKAREVEERTAEIVSNMVASLTLLSQISRDIATKRLLMDAHIFESTSAAHADLERRMASVDADLSRATAAYAPLTTLPDEQATYERLLRDLAATRAPTDTALAFSRVNADREARQALVSAEEGFRAVDDHLDRLVRINEQGVARSSQSVLEIQRRGLLTLGALALAGVTLTALVGVFAIRTALRRDELVREHARGLEGRNEELFAFAGRVAHDLRRPLNTAGLAVAGIDRAATPEQRSRSLQVLERSLKGMAHLIDDLLTLSRLEADRQPVACSVEAIVATVLQEIRPAIEREGGRVNVDVQPASVRCAGEGLLRQVVWNLVENAVKYGRSKEPLRLTVRGRAVGSRYLLEVGDNGPGMSDADAARAFEPLYRGATSQDVPGTGLGLSIVKRVVDASGGAVSVRSHRGVGTTFVVELALATPEPTRRSSPGAARAPPPIDNPRAATDKPEA
jgi:signal transduction histidine kinase